MSVAKLSILLVPNPRALGAEPLLYAFTGVRPTQSIYVPILLPPEYGFSQRLYWRTALHVDGAIVYREVYG